MKKPFAGMDNEGRFVWGKKIGNQFLPMPLTARMVAKASYIRNEKCRSAENNFSRQ